MMLGARGLLADMRYAFRSLAQRPGIAVTAVVALGIGTALRRREIAIRLALGERQRDVRARFVRDGVALAVVGIVLGALVASGVTRFMTELLYGVGAGDPLTFGATALVLVAVAALASYWPARRAATVDPAESLAAE